MHVVAGIQLADTLPLLGNNATVTPLDDYSYTPPYTSPIYHYYYPIINTSIGITNYPIYYL